MNSTVLQAYQFALDPTGAQQQALQSHCGGAGVAFNWGLAQIKDNLDQRQAERDDDVPETALTPCRN